MNFRESSEGIFNHRWAQATLLGFAIGVAACGDSPPAAYSTGYASPASAEASAKQLNNQPNVAQDELLALSPYLRDISDKLEARTTSPVEQLELLSSEACSHHAEWWGPAYGDKGAQAAVATEGWLNKQYAEIQRTALQTAYAPTLGEELARRQCQGISPIGSG